MSNAFHPWPSPGGPRREDLYAEDDAFPRERRASAGHPVAGAVVAYTGLVLATLGEALASALHAASQPEVASAIGALSGQVWLTPALIGLGAALGISRRKQIE